MAVSGVCSGVVGENSGRVTSRQAKGGVWNGGGWIP